jgi:hypothetical protein|tara:strand:- start:12893 stop:13177 length:285 start_codon:yes stop_codon:yes gene_type:complete
MKISFNAKALIKKLDTNVDKTVGSISMSLLNAVRQISPYATGLFKRSWRIVGSKKRYKISNRQPYGHALEHGRSSKAPGGVVGPSITTTKRRYQ